VKASSLYIEWKLRRRLEAANDAVEPILAAAGPTRH
jgi:hypothetical protein